MDQIGAVRHVATPVVLDSRVQAQRGPCVLREDQRGSLMTTTGNAGVDEAASTSLPDAPTVRPKLWVMWANAALSWSLLAFVYLIYLTVRNINWAKRNRLPWFRYAAPLIRYNYSE